MKLALALGEPSPDNMLRNMSYREYREWMAYDMIEPIGPDRFNLLFAHNTCTTAKVGNIDPKKDKSTFEDYYINFENDVLSPAEIAERKRKQKAKSNNIAKWVTTMKGKY